jgi:hypothetical protein
MTTASRQVAVSAPAISLFSLPATVGAGLQDGTYSGSLGGSNHGGVTLHLVSNNARVMLSRTATSGALTTLDIPIANNETSFTYHIHATSGAPADATITATATNFTPAEGTVRVVTPALEMLNLPVTTTTLSASTDFYVRIGIANFNGTGLQQLQPVRSGETAVTVTLANSNPTVAQLTTQQGTGQTRTVSIVPGQSQSPFGVQNGGVALDPIGGGTTRVSATAPGFLQMSTADRAVTVSAPAISLFSLPATIGAGLQDGLYSGSLGGANHGGVTVRLVSSNPAVARLSRTATVAGTAAIDIPVADGDTSFTYYIHGMDGAAGSITLTASAAGFTDATGTVQVVAPAVEMLNAPATTTTLSASTSIYARLGIANFNNTGLNALQAVRTGGAPVTVTFETSTASVAQIRTTAGGAGLRGTVTINPGQSQSPFGIDNGGAELDPVGQGTAVITARAGGFTPMASATHQVTVTAAGITLNSMPTAIGAGLQDFYSGVLGGSDHPALTLRITSSDPSRVLLSRTATTAGTAFVDIPIAAGDTSFSYYIHAVEGTIGDVTITASAPGYVNQTGTVHVVQAGLQIEALGTSTTATGTSDDFYVRVGIPNAQNTALSQSQAVRAGTTMTVTVTNSNANAAQLVTLAGGAQSRTVVIAAGQSNSPTTVGSNGIAFDPLAVGTTTVSAAIPGVAQTAAGVVVVDVR